MKTCTLVWLSLLGLVALGEALQVEDQENTSSTALLSDENDKEEERRLDYYGGGYYGPGYYPGYYPPYYWPPYYPPGPAPAPTPSCPAPKYYSACGSACAPTCSDPYPDGPCTLNCVEGCFCPNGLVVNEVTNQCVYPWQCPIDNTPPAPSPTPSCPTGTELDTLTGTCVAVSCDATNACPYGFQCVPVTVNCVRAPCAQFTCELPTPTCTYPKHYQECGTACPPTCDDPSPDTCTYQCVAGCFCPPGYLLNQVTDTCVLQYQCPNSNPYPYPWYPWYPSYPSYPWYGGHHGTRGGYRRE